jgi:hypothetical protein
VTPDVAELAGLEARCKRAVDQARGYADLLRDELPAPSWRHARFAEFVVAQASHLLALPRIPAVHWVARRPGAPVAIVFPALSRSDVFVVDGPLNDNLELLAHALVHELEHLRQPVGFASAEQDAEETSRRLAPAVYVAALRALGA